MSSNGTAQHAHSPIGMLPFELLAAILAHVDEPFGLLSPPERRVRLVTLLAASSVSRLWHDLSQPLLSWQLELAGGTSGTGGTGVRREEALWRRPRPQGMQVKTLWVSANPILSATVLEGLSELFPLVEEVKLDGRVGVNLESVFHFSNLGTLLLDTLEPFLEPGSPSFPHVITLSFRRLDELLLDAIDHELITPTHVPSFDPTSGPRVAWRVDVGTSSPPVTLPFRHAVLPVEHLVVTVQHNETLRPDERRRRLLRDVAEVLEGTASARTVVVPAALWKPAPSTAAVSGGSVEDRIEELCERRGIVLETYERARLERAPRVSGEVRTRRSAAE
ncbi:hypothetical protein JCM9279_003005 [Rhodotorula babjevae]